MQHPTAAEGQHASKRGMPGTSLVFFILPGSLSSGESEAKKTKAVTRKSRPISGVRASFTGVYLRWRFNGEKVK